MGSNEDGKLGLGVSAKELEMSASPRLVESLKSVKSVATGLSHSLAIAREGSNSMVVYGWGRAENG
jgi:alpha-tubulin suppressor-like RCC1 family protein